MAPGVAMLAGIMIGFAGALPIFAPLRWYWIALSLALPIAAGLVMEA